MRIHSSGHEGLDAHGHAAATSSPSSPTTATLTSNWTHSVALGAMSLLASVAPHAQAAQGAPTSTATTIADTQAVSELRRQIDEMRRQYESRLKEMEARLDQVQQAQASTPAAASTAPASPAQPVADNAGSSAPAANGFNPLVSVILSGTYASLSKDPGTWQLSGFIPGGDEIGPGQRGFSLGESELTLSANIDPWWYGALTLAVSPEDTISAEEAFVQSTSLPSGLKLKVGRFFSGLGYINEQHAHTWDFVDAPLAHQAFLGGQYKQEGVQLKWLAPTDQFIELGAELGNGHSFPGNDRNRNSAGSVSLFAHTGGDVGDSHSWRAGLSWLSTKAQDRTWDTVDAADQNVSNAFTGSSRMWVADAVWKWAPNGNGKETNFKLQGEYFRRTESGDVTYAHADPDQLGLVANTDAYRSAQSGWYLQGIYQFTTGWRVGLRHDELNSGTVDYGLNTANFVLTDYKPKRDSLMLDWSPSEFSRWRLQVSGDRSRAGVNDRQLFLQYQMSLGAHGAHSY